MRLVAVVTCAALLISGGATAQIRVVDGDTFYWEARKIRLWGIDTPERGQRCWLEAKAALFKLLRRGGRGLRCEKRATDRYGREVATCAVRGVDLGLAMILDGWAIDVPRFSGRVYAGAEALARRDRRGRWNEKSCERRPE